MKTWQICMVALMGVLFLFLLIVFMATEQFYQVFWFLFFFLVLICLVGYFKYSSIEVLEKAICERKRFPGVMFVLTFLPILSVIAVAAFLMTYVSVEGVFPGTQSSCFLSYCAPARGLQGGVSALLQMFLALAFLIGNPLGIVAVVIIHKYRSSYLRARKKLSSQSRDVQFEKSSLSISPSDPSQSPNT